MEKQYPTWSGGCAERRRLQEVSVGGSALSEVSEGASAPGGQLRELQDSPLLSCSPPTSATIQTSEVMKVAFSADTEKDYCGDLTTSTGEANSTAQKMTTVGLAEQCSQFCGEEAVPLLVGSIDFGFNQSAMDSVCINSNIVTTDSDRVTQCHEDAESMIAVDVKMSAFITAMNEVELAKIAYETAVAARLPAIKAKIEDKAEDVLKGARADQKAEAYSAFLRTEVFNEVTGSSQQAVKYKTSLDRLGVAVESLQSTVAASIKAYTRFLSDCSDLFTGKGQYNEYLLDQCSQTSTECIDGEGGFGRHSGCCCGYTPFMAVGQEKVSYANTIPGISAEAFEDSQGLARVGNRLLRRLTEAPKSYYDICGSVWEGNAQILANFHAEILSLGNEEVFQDWLNAMKTRYPDAEMCVYEDPPDLPPNNNLGGDNTGGNGSDQVDVSGADGPAAPLPALAVAALAVAAAPRVVQP